MATPTPIFPGAVATDQQLKVANNRIETKLRVSIDAVNTVLFVDSTAGFRANSLVTIDNEIIAIEAVTGAPNPALLVATGGRGFDGTSAATHSAGKKVQVLIDAWHHNALAAEVKAIQSFLGPNGQNIGMGAITAGQYDYAPIQPGGSLAVGSNSIVIGELPPGVAVGGSAYITGGTGTPEAVPITGVGTNSIIVTCANTHSGAWTIASATGGLQEALHAVKAAGGCFLIRVTETITLHATVVCTSQFAHIQGCGISFSDAYVIRAADFATGPMFRATGPNMQLQVSDLYMTSGSNTAPYAAIQADTNAGIMVRDVYASNTIYGIVLDGAASIDIDGFTHVNSGSGTAIAGIRVGPTANGSARIRNIYIAAPFADLNKVTDCILIEAVDGLQADHLWLTGRTGIRFAPTGSQVVFNTYVSDFLIDAFMAAGIWFSSAPTTPMLSIRFANGHINAQHAAGSAASGIDVGYSAASNADDLEFENIKIYDCPRDGVRIGALSSPKAIDFANMQIFHNGVEAGYHGVRIAAGASGIRIRNSTVGNRSFGTAGVQTYGIAAEGNLSDSMIAGNDLSLNGAGPLILAGTFSGLIENNKGIDDVMTQGIASAATITVGVYRFYKVTGTAVIATINGGITGQRKTLQFTDAAPGGVSAAGNIYTAKTAAQNATVTLQFDGTKWVVM